LQIKAEMYVQLTHVQKLLMISVLSGFSWRQADRRKEIENSLHCSTVNYHNTANINIQIAKTAKDNNIIITALFW